MFLIYSYVSHFVGDVVRVVQPICPPKIYFCFRSFTADTNKICTFALSMSQFVIYIKLEKYISEWLTHSLGYPVRFPNGSNENAVIRAFIQQTPKGETPETAAEGMTPIYIPDSKAKPPESYNYMTDSGKKAVREAIMDLFTRNLWNELRPIDSIKGVGVNTRIAAWCEMHGIGLDRVETVRQKYYRIREAYKKRGINLQNFTRNNSDKDP